MGTDHTRPAQLHREGLLEESGEEKRQKGATKKKKERGVEGLCLLFGP